MSCIEFWHVAAEVTRARIPHIEEHVPAPLMLCDWPMTKIVFQLHHAIGRAAFTVLRGHGGAMAEDSLRERILRFHRHILDEFAVPLPCHLPVVRTSIKTLIRERTLTAMGDLLGTVALAPGLLGVDDHG